ncbi:MAG: hypothetical protein GXO36_06090 [Chloroflexi bacterium]|nr:hypothetical protein [Chloroflexota bacterium]
MVNWRPYRTLVELSIRQATAYRMNYFLSFIVAAVPLIALLLLWETIYGTETQLAGFDRAQMLTYFILTRWLYELTRPTIWWDITYEVREGDLVFHLLRPFPYGLYHFALIVGFNLPYALIGLAVVAPFAWIVGAGWIWPASLATWLAFGVSAGLAFVLGYAFTLLFSLSAFWLEENSAVELLVHYITPLAAGALLPLDLLPGPLAALLARLPFAKLLYFPAQVYLGRVSGTAFWTGLAEQGLWLLGLILVNTWVWHQGLRRFRAVGG